MAGTSTPKITVKITANFERNLEDAERFLLDAEAPQAFDALLDELTDIVIPNLEQFPDMGRAFNARPIGSVEASNAHVALQKQLQAIAKGGEVRKYILASYLILYARHENVIYLLSIRHHRQLSFDFAQIWG